MGGEATPRAGKRLFSLGGHWLVWEGQGASVLKEDVYYIAKNRGKVVRGETVDSAARIGNNRRGILPRLRGDTKGSSSIKSS